MRKSLIWLASSLLCQSLTTIAATAQPTTQRVMRIAMREDPDLLDPTLGSSYVGRVVYAGLCDKLFDIDQSLHIVPQLATGYDYRDPTHLVIHLRPNVTFQDNEPFNADAVKLKIIRDLTAKGSLRAGEVSSVQSVEIIDPLTVMLVLKAPNAALLAQLTDRAGIMISPKAVAETGDKFGLHPVCAGPFAFEQRIPQDRIVLTRYAGYWDAANIHLDRVIYLPQPNSTVRLANLQAGSVDLVEYIVPSDVPAVQRDAKLKLAIGDALGYTGITINISHGPAADTPLGRSALVRQALDMAIDRQALVQVVYNGMYTPIGQANAPTSPFYVPAIQPPPRDIEKAKALLAQAGVTLPVPVILTVPNNPDLLQAAEVMQAMAKDAGFDIRIKAMEFASSLQAARNGEFESYLIYFSGRSDADGNMWQFLHTGGEANWGRYANPTVDGLLDAARIELDSARRRDIYGELWQQARQDVPIVYLWIFKNIVAMQRGVTGFRQVPDGLIRFTGMEYTPTR
jgi:peptide/nickel transport system substrate-binding protein